MNLAYNLGKENSGQKILQDIVGLCNKVTKEELRNTCLVISLVKIVDSENNIIPLIENKEPL